MHFSDKMVLLHVKYLPSLVQQLQKIVDDALLAASGTLPRKWLPLSTVTRDFITTHLASTVANDEKAVAEIYGKTAATFCAPLASTLALHPKASKDEWGNLLRWTQSVSSSGYAIMDGELQIMPGHNDFDNIVETMDPETRVIVKEMRDSRTSLGTWEFKSLATGSDDVMEAVHGFDDFSWTFCSGELFGVLQWHQRQAENVKRTVRGPDAQNPPWTLDVCSFIPKLVDLCHFSIE
jgi:hypothetical protein